MKVPRTRRHCQHSGRCTRENCKYLHPPPHLKTQLEINGRNTLATQKMLQNLQSQQLQQVVGMSNLHQLQPTPSSAQLLAGGQGLPAGPGSNQIMIPTSSAYTGKDAANAAAATSLFHQHASPQMYNGLQIMQQSPYTIPASGQGQAQVHANQAATDINAMYSPFYLPVAVSMQGQTMSVGTHSTANPYGSYFMPFQNPNIGQLTPSQASSMGLVPDLQGLQTQMIQTGHTGQGLQMMPSMKKNDKLELPTTPDTPSLKRPRDPADDALLQTLSGLAPPPPKKITAGGLGHHQGAGHMMNFFSPSQFPYHHHPQLGPAMMTSHHQPTPVVPTPFPVMPSMAPAGHGQNIPLFAPMMPTQVHPTRHPQSNETIPVCRDFKSGSCKRPSCKYAHVTEDYVEIIDGKVTLCRYAVQNRCTRQRCKFYHPPPASSALAAMVSPAVQMSLPPQGISSI